MSKAVDAYITKHQERFIEELKTLLRFPSISAQRQHDADSRACAQWLRQHFTKLGLKAALIDNGGQPIVRAGTASGSGRRLVIYGHYDVQPEDPRKKWHHDPFEPVLKDGYLIARGATDDKGQFFAHVKAVEALLKTPGGLPGEVVFLIEGEEESGGQALAHYVRSEGIDLKPEAVVVSDGTMYDETTPALTYGLRGIITFEVQIQGPTHDLHSGAYGGAVANPIQVLAQLLSHCVAPNGSILIPHFYDRVAPLKAWERENIKSLAFDDQRIINECGVPSPHGESGYTSLERIWARPTFEINGLHGGYDGEHSKTIIPTHAMAKISMRLVPGQDPGEIRRLTFDFLHQHCPRSVHLEIPEYVESPAVLFDTHSPIMQQAQAALEAGFGVKPVWQRCGGSIPVVNDFVQAWQCPVILMGLGQDSDAPHSPNERFKIADFLKGIKASAHLLQSMK